MEDTQVTPLQPQPQPQPLLQPQPINTKKPKKLLLPLVLAVFIIAFGAVAYWQYSEASQAKTDKASAVTQVSALQGQVSALQAQVSSLQSAAASTASGSGATSSTKTDNEMIISVVTAYVHGQKGNADAKVTINVDKMQLPFARAQVNAGQTGYACVLKKVDGSWLQLYCAQGASDYTQSQDEMYEVPSSIIAS